MSGDSVSSLDAMDLRIRKLRKISAKRRLDRVDSNNWAERSLVSSEDETEDLEYLRSIENERPLKDRSSDKLPKSKVQGEEYETDVTVLKRRQKQIDYGKNTKGYNKYLEMIPKSKRRAKDIWTPNKYLKYSRRSWDGQVRRWRKALHRFDPEESSDSEDCKERERRVKAVMAFLEPLVQKPKCDESTRKREGGDLAQESDGDDLTPGTDGDDPTHESDGDEPTQEPDDDEPTQEPDGDEPTQKPEVDEPAQKLDEPMDDSECDELLVIDSCSSTPT